MEDSVDTGVEVEVVPLDIQTAEYSALGRGQPVPESVEPEGSTISPDVPLELDSLPAETRVEPAET
jgi:hypothetical protein